jgi:small conductance mechanosensitive channel
MAISWGARIIGVLLILFGALILAGWLKRLVVARLEKTTDKTLARFLGGMVRWVVLVLAFVGCLGLFGIETTSFAAVLGGASVAIGLAMKGTLSNVAAGAMLLVFRPYKVGDVVKVDGTQGKVDEIGLFTTTLDTPDKRRFIIPNGIIFGDTIENVTFHEERRVDVNVGVGYDADIDETRKVLINACQGLEHINGEVVAYLQELGGSSVNWQVRVICPTEHYWEVREAVTRAVKLALDAADIDIPYPNVVVHGAPVAAGAAAVAE